MRRVAWLLLPCLALALAASGCAGWTDNQDFNAWRDVEKAKWVAWAQAQQARAAHPRQTKLVLEPIDNTKPLNAKLTATIVYPEPPSTWTPPPVSDRPKSTGELVADVIKAAPRDVAHAVLGWKGIEVGGEVLKASYRAAGNKTTIGGDWTGQDKVGGNQVTGGSTYVGRDGNWNSHNPTTESAESAE